MRAGSRRSMAMPEAELVGEYMMLALERPSFLEPESKAGYHWGRDADELEIKLGKLALLISSL
jgi:hypothetical protein